MKVFWIGSTDAQIQSHWGMPFHVRRTFLEQFQGKLGRMQDWNTREATNIEMYRELNTYVLRTTCSL